jgi:hypothetical protein
VKLLLVIVDESHKEELETLLQKVGAAGYTEIPHAVGVGMTGPRMGSRAFPKTSAVIFSALEDGVLERLRDEVRAYCHECGERIKMIAWDAEEIVL